VRRLCLGLLCLAACTTGGDGRAKEAPSEAATSTNAPTTTSTAEQACDSFELFWEEFAQIYNGPMASPPGKDPHSQPAQDAIARAFALAKAATPEMQELGRQAELQYSGDAEGDLLATVKTALAVCGRTPPHTVCSPNSVCELMHMNVP